jgi:peptidyl-tRNA hydrolase, PTH1 family
MSWILVGLGNPGPEYAGTRHNVGREFLEALAPKLPKKAKVILPDVYMNNSGAALKQVPRSKAALEQLVVLHDELDLPLGRVKISFGGSAAGHNGVKSVQKALKSEEFVRIRIGISGATPKGKLKRPAPEKIADYVLAKFKSAELAKLKAVRKTVAEALELLMEEGLERARTEINAR